MTNDNQKQDQDLIIEDLSAKDAEANNVKGGIEIRDCLITNYSMPGHG